MGCGKRTVSLRRGARTGAGVAAAVELRMGSKKSFLLSRRQNSLINLRTDAPYNVWSFSTLLDTMSGVSLLKYFHC